MNQSSSKKKKKMSKKSSFIGKLLKKVSCLHLPEDSVSEEDVSHHDQQQPPKQQQQQRKQPQQLVITFGGVGVDEGSMTSHEVPSKYASYATFRALLERSGEDLETILSRGWVVICCEIAEFESKLKFLEALVKAKEREADCKESSYDERLWATRSKKSSMENSIRSNSS